MFFEFKINIKSGMQLIFFFHKTNVKSIHKAERK
jgi:hypothetical protein